MGSLWDHLSKLPLSGVSMVSESSATEVALADHRRPSRLRINYGTTGMEEGLTRIETLPQKFQFNQSIYNEVK